MYKVPKIKKIKRGHAQCLLTLKRLVLTFDCSIESKHPFIYRLKNAGPITDLSYE